jgi:hypothetical protein
MLDIWLIPVLVLAGATLCGLFLVIKLRGGSGDRTEGRTLVHKQVEEENLPPG